MTTNLMCGLSNVLVQLNMPGMVQATTLESNSAVLDYWDGDYRSALCVDK